MVSSYPKQAGIVPALAAYTYGFVHIPCGKKFISLIQEILLLPTSSFTLRLWIWIHQTSSSFGCTWFIFLMYFLMRWAQPLLQGVESSCSRKQAEDGTQEIPRFLENHFHHRSGFAVWEQVSRKYVESAYLKMLKALLAKDLSSLLWLDMCWRECFQMAFRRPLSVFRSAVLSSVCKVYCLNVLCITCQGRQWVW